MNKTLSSTFLPPPGSYHVATSTPPAPPAPPPVGDWLNPTGLHDQGGSVQGSQEQRQGAAGLAQGQQVCLLLVLFILVHNAVSQKGRRGGPAECARIAGAADLVLLPSCGGGGYHRVGGGVQVLLLQLFWQLLLQLLLLPPLRSPLPPGSCRPLHHDNPAEWHLLTGG